MAKPKFTIGSFITFHPDYEGDDNCGFCGKGGKMKWSIPFDYESSRIIDWRDDEQSADCGEVPVCYNCYDDFDPLALIEI